MLDNFFKNMSTQTQGTIAVILGLILIFGTLGKLEILQDILNSIMIIVGLILLFWGMHTSKLYFRIKDYLAHAQKDKPIEKK